MASKSGSFQRGGGKVKVVATREETGNVLKVTIELEKPKVDNSRFEMVCILIGIFIVGSGLLKFFSMLV